MGECGRQFSIGLTVLGTVREIVNFGVFIDVAKRIKGLIHISEIESKQDDDNPFNLFKIGDKVEVNILNICKKRKRISLKLNTEKENNIEKLLQKYTDRNKRE